MATNKKTDCAVPECTTPTAEPDVEKAISIFKAMPEISVWFASHGDEYGAILLIQLALVAHFNGARGFEKTLRTQGFVDIRHLRTLEGCEAATAAVSGKKVGSWSGFWRAQYSWEPGADQKNENSVG